MNWEWVTGHLPLIGQLLGEHVFLSVLPVVIGLAVSLPLGIVCSRYPALYGPVLLLTSVLYAVPSLALFVFLLGVTGLHTTTVVIPLALYTLSVLVRNVVDGMRSVPDAVRDAAVGMGFGPLRRLVQVELPIAVPLIMAGTRVATVSNISMVSIGALLGFGGLGQLFTTYGIQLNFFLTAILTGVVLTVALAVAADTIIVGIQRLLTPWAPRGAGR
ncbi:MAG: osmoprotectant transport system permease protein [Actinomycetota bacterium]|nr:binding-protein-dependent transport system inner rane component [Cryptosporangiaceae bacterium]MDQ1676602.1 osmoprotectant transport system permease protein [Actinomycetota bacterium]